jgi:hypothetical protein|nr:MAG TPA: Phosphodiester glycosidase [Caudoviricetes sp.]
MPFQTVRVNEYTQLDIIPFDSIQEVRFCKLAEPTEMLEHYYNRAENKPNIMVNGGLFDMKTGHNVMSFVSMYTEQNYKNGFVGMGTTCYKAQTLQYGKDNEKEWRDFMTAYPMLVIDGKANKEYGNAKTLNYRTARTAIGVTETGNVLVLTVDKPGMTFEQMTAIFLQYHAVYAMNLDGGGSVRKLHNGKVVNNPSENRKVDSAFCVYLKKDPLAMYEDKDNIDDWARDAVEIVTNYGVMQGDNHGKFNPNKQVTRQELAVALSNMITKIQTSAFM